MHDRQPRHAHLARITGGEVAFIIGVLVLCALVWGATAVVYELTGATETGAVTSSVIPTAPAPSTK
ncbi:hypothetical protein [Mycobacterium sp. SMC-17]|uniref:hypothetical protein n=1 Tax=Mycobacterium sp. SMC-17 TaxID=3381628 RepID=UPI003876610D